MGMERDEAIECATANFGLTFFWGIMVFMNVAFFFVMLIAVTWCCSCLCVAVLMICTFIVSPEVLRSQSSQAAAQNSTIVKKALKRINSMKKKFKSVTEKQRTDQAVCAICYEDYQDNDDVTELSCTGRHIIHTNCMVKWVKSSQSKSLNCPLCN